MRPPVSDFEKIIDGCPGNINRSIVLRLGLIQKAFKARGHLRSYLHFNIFSCFFKSSIGSVETSIFTKISFKYLYTIKSYFGNIEQEDIALCYFVGILVY